MVSKFIITCFSSILYSIIFLLKYGEAKNKLDANKTSGFIFIDYSL